MAASEGPGEPSANPRGRDVDPPPSHLRSAIMARVKSSDTSPEMKVRSALHRLGYRYVLHNKRLPGCPDLSFPSRRVAIFVHGCFWHRHPGCKRASTPVSRATYWAKKFNRNVERDLNAQRQLNTMGWTVVILWECELKSTLWLVNLIETLDLPGHERCKNSE
jgi:DNA mismatch endonuclease (patch repair protein)